MPASEKPYSHAQRLMRAGQSEADGEDTYTSRMTEELTFRLYSAAQTRELDRRAIQEHGIAGYALMQRAAAAAWRAARARWPQARSVAVVCGPGNNGGDGYEVARLAKADGCAVRVAAYGSAPQRGEAAAARAAWQREGPIEDAAALDAGFFAAEIIVDGLFGSGLARAPEGGARTLIERINAARAHGARVLALDLPSGLHADTGAAPGVAVRADLTVTFIGRKFGLYTGAGAELCGQIVFDDLGVPPAVYADLEPVAELLVAQALARVLPRRPRSAHKGEHGHVLVVGGETGLCGAALLCARAALRSGAGLVSVATRAVHAAALAAAQPEAMCRGVESQSDLAPLLARASVLALGPGLGQGAWGRLVYEAALAAGKPLVVDADALNWLAQFPQWREDWILTPHPGEAARLLGSSAAAVQADRRAAARALRERYGGVVVLKGAGSLIQGQTLAVCPYGNPGMATGGMGDALTGIVAALLAQGLALETAARTGVLAHALAGDRAAGQGERGLLVSDLIEALRVVVNPQGV
jgi:hydroxyethylthiazole kinase-like uncharacterized protein yjeF